MADEGNHDNSFLWNDDQSWTFPVLAPVEDNGGKVLIDSGRIVMDAPAEQEQQRVNDKGKKRVSVSDDHDLHIQIERERRKKMRDMFAILHDLMPHLHPRADKTSIVDEAVEYIKHLRVTLEDLEKHKEKKLKGENESSSTSQLVNLNASFTTLSYPNVVVSVCGIDAHINVVCSPTKPRTITYLVFLIDKYNLDLVSAHVSSGIYMLHVRANGVPQQFPEAAPFLVEETYKQVAAELILWINS
ncbi:transcription factor bHLH95-like [Salvia splendens]|uniref:transcription factor bHLH95-like n=1 Tax=Salvia splendens TaxID=180675 RepID=UPI001C278774|nr:transcription factor bHLH95-like [Salvia splendens]